MKKFTNTTNKDFTCSWDGKEQTFLRGESAVLENGVAEAFAKHLANQKFEGTLVTSDQTFIDEMNKYLSDPTEEIIAEEITEQIFVEAKEEIDEAKEEAKAEKVVEEMVKVEPKKKGRKAKKEIFEGLEDETNI